MYNIGNESFMWPLGSNKRLCWVIEARSSVEVKVLFYGSCLIEAVCQAASFLPSS